MDPKKIMQIGIIGSLALVIVGQLVDEAFYYTAPAQTANVTGVSAVVMSFLGLIFLVALFMTYVGLI